MSYCSLCQANNVCSSCNAPFVPVNGLCACNSTFIQSGNTCVCPQTLILNPEGNQCVACSIQYCATCISTTSAITCQTCSSPFVSNGSGGCQCPSTFIESNGGCVCPSNFTLSSGVCYSCSPQYCTQCAATNVCSACSNTFTPVNGAC